MSALLATLVVIAMVLFGTAAARAHGGHRDGAIAGAVSTQPFAVNPEVPLQVEGAGKLASLFSDQSASASRNGSNDSYRSADISCCGIGITVCASGILNDAWAFGSRPAMGSLHWQFGLGGSARIDDDGLIKPPKLSV